MKHRGQHIALGAAVFCIAAIGCAGAEDLLALRGNPAAPVQNNMFTPAPPEKQTESHSLLFGPIKYLEWKNSCARIAPIVAGGRLSLPDPNFAHVAPCLPIQEPGPGFVQTFVQSLLGTGG